MARPWQLRAFCREKHLETFVRQHSLTTSHNSCANFPEKRGEVRNTNGLNIRWNFLVSAGVTFRPGGEVPVDNQGWGYSGGGEGVPGEPQKNVFFGGKKTPSERPKGIRGDPRVFFLPWFFFLFAFILWSMRSGLVRYTSTTQLLPKPFPKGPWEQAHAPFKMGILSVPGRG